VEGVTGIVDEDVNSIRLGDYGANGALDGSIVGEIEFDDAQVKGFPLSQLARSIRVAILDGSHCGRDVVALALESRRSSWERSFGPLPSRRHASVADQSAREQSEE
jgi:hypothetical protein